MTLAVWFLSKFFMSPRTSMHERDISELCNIDAATIFPEELKLSE